MQRSASGGGSGRFDPNEYARKRKEQMEKAKQLRDARSKVGGKGGDDDYAQAQSRPPRAPSAASSGVGSRGQAGYVDPALAHGDVLADRPSSQAYDDGGGYGNGGRFGPVDEDPYAQMPVTSSSARAGSASSATSASRLALLKKKHPQLIRRTDSAGDDGYGQGAPAFREPEYGAAGRRAAAAAAAGNGYSQQPQRRRDEEEDEQGYRGGRRFDEDQPAVARRPAGRQPAYDEDFEPPPRQESIRPRPGGGGSFREDQPAVARRPVASQRPFDEDQPAAPRRAPAASQRPFDEDQPAAPRRAPAARSPYDDEYADPPLRQQPAARRPPWRGAAEEDEPPPPPARKPPAAAARGPARPPWNDDTGGGDDDGGYTPSSRAPARKPPPAATRAAPRAPARPQWNDDTSPVFEDEPPPPPPARKPAPAAARAPARPKWNGGGDDDYEEPPAAPPRRAPPPQRAAPARGQPAYSADQYEDEPPARQPPRAAPSAGKQGRGPAQPAAPPPPPPRSSNPDDDRPAVARGAAAGEGGITGFFKSLFGGGRPSSPSAAAAVGLPPEALEEDTGPLEECPDCGRSFAAEALERHSRVCQRVFQQKRKQFDSTKARVAGTEAAKFVEKAKAKERADARPAKGGRPAALDDRPVQVNKKQKWKAEHEAFQAAIRAARQYSDAKAKGMDVRDIPAAPSLPDDRTLCPTCGRKFGETAFERHVQHCKNIISKPKSLARGAGISVAAGNSKGFQPRAAPAPGRR